MKNYAYRTELTEEERRDPFIAAAFAVASRAHLNQQRYKLDPKIPYITHPLMVMDILTHMGVIDSRMQAAALLHDTLEDYKIYRNTAEQDAVPDGSMRKNNDRMHNDLIRELQNYVDRGWLTKEAAAEGAAIIFDLAKQVTKPVVYDENDKLQAQIDKISYASLQGKILKIADQAASLVCRLMAPDNAKKFTPEKQVETRKKAANLVGYIFRSVKSRNKKEALKPWADFFHHVEEHTRRFDEGNKFVKRDIYESFDFEDFFKQVEKKAKRPAILQEREVVLRYPIPPAIIGNISSTLIRVDVNSQMKVVQFVMRRGDGPDNPVYDIRRRLVNVEIPITNKMAYQYTQPKAEKVETDGIIHMLSDGETVAGRLYTLHPAMSLQAFMGTAYRAGACSLAQDIETQREVAKKIDSPNAPLKMDQVWLARIRSGNDQRNGAGAKR